MLELTFDTSFKMSPNVFKMLSNGEVLSTIDNFNFKAKRTFNRLFNIISRVSSYSVSSCYLSYTSCIGLGVVWTSWPKKLSHASVSTANK